MCKEPDPAPIRRPLYSGFIIIRLIDSIEPAEVDTLQEYACLRGLEELAEILKRLGQPATKRAIWSLSVEMILKLERQVADSKWKPPHSLASYWRLDARGFWRDADLALKQLNNLKAVGFAYKELATCDPAIVNPDDDDLFEMQGYLKPAPVGIDANSVWQRNAKGEGVALIDLENGWYPFHEDLAPAPPIIFGDNYTPGADHGTSVLGIAIGRDNDRGIVGVAPGVSSVRLVSRYHEKETSGSEVACAIGLAISLLQPGDVLLLEVQRDFKPTEIDNMDFTAISVAVAHGIIVIEAAGNGNLNLDHVVSQDGARSLNTKSPRYKDSGAIVVGACRSRSVEIKNGIRGHRRHGRSNYGSRVNCYAWGEDIVTASTTYGEPNNGLSRYTYGNNVPKFGGTSGASAIIAGAALLLQSLYEAKKNARLLPNVTGPSQNMRAVLSDTETGTGQQLNYESDPIGVMPDLKSIIKKLGLT
jgi:serine protease